MTNNFRGKRVLVMGLGLHGGGLGTVRFLLKEGAKVTVTDLRTRRELAPTIKSLSHFKNIRYTLGRHSKGDILSSDLIIKNPGVPLDSPHIVFAKKRGIPVTSDMGIFFSRCPAKIIGVTGTRGKSTTAFLISKLLNPKRRKVFLGGNIRKSVLEILPKIKKEDWVVLELSSFQLEDLARDKISPEVAVFTNIYRDHLNRHKNMADYIRAKSFIFRFQKKKDVLFANPDDNILRRIVKSAPSRVLFARLPKELRKIVDEKLGEHYRSSVGLAVGVAKYLGVSQTNIKRVLKGLKGLEGRQEYLGVVRGVSFVNDTTATIPDATIAAVKRFRKRAGKRKLILIAGGQDKKLKFKEMVNAINRYVDHLILLPGTATEKLKLELGIKNKELGDVRRAKTMKEAVRTAFRMAKKGDWVVLSPGAASFGLFLNEFDRGDKFVKAVRGL